MPPKFAVKVKNIPKNTQKSTVGPTLALYKSKNFCLTHEMRVPTDSPGSPLLPKQKSSNSEIMDFSPPPSNPQNRFFFWGGVALDIKGIFFRGSIFLGLISSLVEKTGLKNHFLYPF